MPEDSVHRQERTNQEARGLSRREVLVGAAAGAMAIATPIALGSNKTAKHEPAEALVPTSMSNHRHMAAGALLGDGRVLITGGFNRFVEDGVSLVPLNSAVIFDPNTGMAFEAAPMHVSRARHAAVSLADGRVAVIGGMGTHVLASVEIYDLRTNTWTYADSLRQPRFDHVAVSDGMNVFVCGGVGQQSIRGSEVLNFALLRRSEVRP